MPLRTQVPLRRRRAAARPKHAAPRRVRMPAPAVVHAFVVIVGWALLFGFWIGAVLNSGPGQLLDMLLLVAVTLGGVLLLTLLWVAHNVSIYRRKGPRRTAMAVDELFTHDFVGRPLVADWVGLQRSARVQVRIGGARKHYEALGTANRTAQASLRDDGGEHRAADPRLVGAGPGEADRAERSQARNAEAR